MSCLFYLILHIIHFGLSNTAQTQQWHECDVRLKIVTKYFWLFRCYPYRSSMLLVKTHLLDPEVKLCDKEWQTLEALHQKHAVCNTTQHKGLECHKGVKQQWWQPYKQQKKTPHKLVRCERKTA